jgi:putative sigma-54 modulation protein
MRLQIKALHDTLDDSVRAYVEKRIGKLGKRLYDQTLVEVALWKEKNPSIREDHSAEVIVYTKGPNLVARESALTYEAAIDLLVEKLERQIERYRDKRVHEPRRGAQKRGPAAPPPVEELDLEEPGKPDEAAA